MDPFSMYSILSVLYMRDHPGCSMCQQFINFYCSVAFHCVDIPVFVLLTFALFLVFPIINDTIVNILVYGFWCMYVHISVGYILRHGISGSRYVYVAWNIFTSTFHLANVPLILQVSA